MRLTYDIETDWIIMSTCNFRCNYCFWGEDDLGRKIEPPGAIEEFVHYFDESGLIWLLHITGGEPFFYPRFVELCQLLTQKHYISLNSNVDSKEVIAFAETVDPARVESINCGLHIEQREMRHRVDDFVMKVNLLQQRGFFTFVSSVMYPTIFHGFPENFEYFLDKGIVVIPKSLQGIHEGKLYPNSYTTEERSLFVEYSLRAEALLAPVFSQRAEPPTINPFMDRERFLYELPDHRGKLCNAGYKFVRLRENGDVRRCGSQDVLGNIFQGNVKLNSSPRRCNEIECPYFCEKHLMKSSLSLV